MASEPLRGGDLDTLVSALAGGRKTVVVAPNGTVNTGLVTGDQRQIVTAPVPGTPAAGPARQGPVRAKDLRTARRRFVAPPGFGDALAALDSGISVLVGAPGSGRETHALNLLAHGRDEPVLVQVDGAVDLSRWVPRPQGVHGYLVMEPPEPFALRPWDLSRLEATLTEAGARLLIVLPDTPGPATALEERLGTPVVRHLPPDPREVFAAHLADVCSDDGARRRLLRALGPDIERELLPRGLPPRHAAQAAATVARLGATGGSSCAGVLRTLARAEAAELVAQVQDDHPLLAHLISLSVYGGLDREVVTDRAADLLRLMDPGRPREPGADPERPAGSRPGGDAGRHQAEPGEASREDPAAGHRPDTPHRRRSLPGILRALGAQATRRSGTDPTDTVAFFWPAVGDAVREALCRDRADLLPLLHVWLAGTGEGPEQAERAARAVAAMARATGGRTLDLLRPVASAPWPSAVEVAARSLGAAARDPATTAGATALLDRWSGTTEAVLRRTVAHACRPELGGLTARQALDLAGRLMETPCDDVMPVLTLLQGALVRHFALGDTATRAVLLARLTEWADDDGVPGLLAALTFPLLAGTDPAWWGRRIVDDPSCASATVGLAGHALDEPSSYPAMRDVLFAWSCEADGTPPLGAALEELLTGLAAARQPGFLRWLLAVGRTPDALPVKDLAARLLTTLHGRPTAPTTD